VTTAPAPRRVAVDGVELAVHVADLGLACCGVEVSAALHDGSRGDAGPAPAGTAAALHVLLVSGTVTDVLAPALARAWAEVPEPRWVVSVGACCATGGPYWDSYAVTKGVDQLVPVHVSVPGCPPRPEAVLAGLRAVVGLAAQDEPDQHEHAAAGRA
jgi:NADH-quinone oxidoreductase subunit B